MNLIEVANEQAGLRKLQNNELDGYITTLATASYYMQELGLADVKVIGRIPADWSLSVATRKDEPVVLGIMQKLVSSLTAEERKNLERQWRNIRIKQSVDYTLIWQLSIAAIVITLLLVYWNRKLNRLNRDLTDANETLARLSVTDDLTSASALPQARQDQTTHPRNFSGRQTRPCIWQSRMAGTVLRHARSDQKWC